MIGLIPAILGFAAGGANLLLDRFRPKLTLRWTLNILASGLILLVSIVIGLLSPAAQIFQLWQLETIGTVDLVFLFDDVSWIFAIGLSAILLLSALSGNRTPASQAAGKSARVFFIVSALLLLFSAENLIALVVGLVALDLIHSTGDLFSTLGYKPFDGRIQSLGVRLVSVSLLLFSLFLGDSNQFQETYGPTTDWQSALILLAAGLRLGIYYPALIGRSWGSSLPEQDSYAILLSAASGISGLALLTWLGSADQAGFVVVSGLIMALAASVTSVLTALSGRSVEGLAGGMFALLAVLAFCASLFSSAVSVSPWSLAALYAAGLMIFVGGDKRLRVLIFPVVLILCVGLPFTPTWAGSNLYSSVNWLLVFLLIIPHSFINAYLLDFAWHHEGPVEDVDDYQALLRRLIAFMMLLVFIGLGVWQALVAEWRGNFWSGGLVLILSLGLYFLLRSKRISIPQQLEAYVLRWLTFNWVGPIVQAIFRSVQNVVRLLTSVMEGASGLLWSMLLLVILISVLITLIQS